jgi:hypothetical protein
MLNRTRRSLLLAYPDYVNKARGSILRELLAGNVFERFGANAREIAKTAPSAILVSLLSPAIMLGRQIVIAWHSPDGVIETGLLGCPPEKKAATLADSNEQDTFSGPV